MLTGDNQRTADAMVAEAERKSAQIMNNAQTAADSKAVDTDAVAAQADEIVRQETERMNNAKRTAQNFIEVLEQDIRGHLDLLEKLKQEDLTITEPAPVKRAKPFDYDEAQEKPLVVPKAEPVAAPAPVVEPSPSTEQIANEIEQNITRLMDMEEPAPEATTRPTSMDSSTIKFTNLQFGRNYDPTSR